MVGMLDSKTGVRSNDSAAAADDEGEDDDACMQRSMGNAITT